MKQYSCIATGWLSPTEFKGKYSCFTLFCFGVVFLWVGGTPMSCIPLSLTHCASCCCTNPRLRFLYPLFTRASILLGRPIAHSHIIFSQITSSRTSATAKMRKKITIFFFQRKKKSNKLLKLKLLIHFYMIQNSSICNFIMQILSDTQLYG